MPQVPLTELIKAAISGKVVSFPTDTVPALAVCPDRADRLFATKQRPPDKPLILMGATRQDLWDYVAGTADEREIWQVMAEKYWPGALTLVLPASDRVPAAVNPLDPTTIGLRIPDCAIACQILAQTGCLATTSANRSGEPPLEDLAAIAKAFPAVAVLDPVFLDPAFLKLNDPIAPSPVGSGLPSTVVKWTGTGWQILRQGLVEIA